MPVKYKPMLAKIGSQDLLNNKKLWFEPKLDGYRALCYMTQKGIKLYSRRGIDITHQFPELATITKHIKATSCILDGEIVGLNKNGFSDFKLIQGRSQLTNSAEINTKTQQHAATYAVFDILSKNGVSFIKQPYIKRRALLEKTIKLSKHIVIPKKTHDGKKLFTFMKKHKQEGVMAKDPQGMYSPGKRTRAWQKVKVMKSIECILLGYTHDVKAISSLALGLYDAQGKLTYVGRVGTGFSQINIKELLPRLKKNHATKPATQMPVFKNLIYLKPTLVGEIKYLELTPTGTLRHTSYLHYRDDKKPKACTFDQIV